RDLSGSLPGPAWPLTTPGTAAVLLIPPLGRRSRDGGAVAVALAQSGDLILEVGERLESSVDRGEPEVGHLVQIPERAQDGQAHLVRGDLAQPPCPDRLLHLLGQDCQLVLADRPSLACPLHATDDLVPGEGLGDTAALGDHQDDRLLGGEPPSALRARPATADRGAIIGRPAVDDPAVGVPAERAVHAIASLRRRSCSPISLPVNTTCGKNTSV